MPQFFLQSRETWRRVFIATLYEKNSQFWHTFEETEYKVDHKKKIKCVKNEISESPEVRNKKENVVLYGTLAFT